MCMPRFRHNPLNQAGAKGRGIMRRTLAVVIGAGCICLGATTAVSSTFPGTNGRIAYDLTPAGGPYTIHTILPSGDGEMRLGKGSMPAWSPSGKRIAFVLPVNSQAEIYSMAADGGDVRRLTHSPGDELAPSYSPSGDRIVFNGEAGIVVMRSDGSGQRVLSRRGAGPTYSPDGKWIAYVVGSTSKLNASIWVMRRNGTDKHRLLSLGGNGGAIGSYSPDGSRISFSRCGSQCRYFVASSNGKQVRRLPCPPAYFRGVTAPSYSPDGRRLLGETPQVSIIKLPLHSCSPTVIARLSEDDAALPDWQPLPVP
jgi:WD40 repeat protein